MSIIEKAAHKLAQRERNISTVAPSVHHINSDDTNVPTFEYDTTIPEQQAPVERGRVAGRNSPEPASGLGIAGRQVNIDLARLHQMGIITHFDEKSQIAEEFRVIKRPLILDAFSRTGENIKNSNLIMVTSALPGEGKSFCAMNLAMSIAMEMDHTVLLVDADIARPSLPGYLGLKAEKGLLDVLVDSNTELSDVIMRTNIDKISLLLSGKKSKYATELLASQSMSDLLTDISRRYHDRIIIFDSPPLLLTTESRVLAAQMGQIVLVVESETTPQNKVMEALEQLEACNDIKLIYNKSQYFTSRHYYDYYN